MELSHCGPSEQIPSPFVRLHLKLKAIGRDIKDIGLEIQGLGFDAKVLDLEIKVIP